MTDSELHEKLLAWRGIELDDACTKCSGSGKRSYGSTATWRGGMGGCMITSDVCDVCWGSGDRYHPGANLRQLRSEESARIAKAALTAVTDSVGAYTERPVLRTKGGGAIGEVLLELDKLLDRRRVPMSIFAQATLCGLRNLIARAIGVNERKL